MTIVNHEKIQFHKITFITPFPPDSYRDSPSGEGDLFPPGGNKKGGKRKGVRERG